MIEDWSHAMAHQGTYSVHPKQNHTSFPANIDDADLIESDVVQSKPLNIHTVSGIYLLLYTLVKLRYRRCLHSYAVYASSSFIAKSSMKSIAVDTSLIMHRR